MLQETGRNKMEKRPKTREGLGFESVDVDLYSTGAAVECGRRPGYPAVAVNLNVHMQGHIEHTVIAANNDGEDREFKKKKQILLLAASPVHRFDNRI